MEMKLATYCSIAIVILFLSGAWAQEASCIRQLLPCLSLLNTSHNQSDSCCGPLKYVTEVLPECLCSMIGTGGPLIPELAGINLTEVQKLPERCGQPINFLGCITGTPNSNTDITNTASHSFGSRSTYIVTALLMTLQVPWAL